MRAASAGVWSAALAGSISLWDDNRATLCWPEAVFPQPPARVPEPGPRTCEPQPGDQCRRVDPLVSGLQMEPAGHRAHHP